MFGGIEPIPTHPNPSQPLPTHPSPIPSLQARVVPTTDIGVIDFFLDTEMQEMEYEIARFRPRLGDEFFDALRNEMGNIRFAANASVEEKEKLAELEALEKVLKEGIGGWEGMGIGGWGRAWWLTTCVHMC